MADSAELTPAQMIAEMQKAGFKPPTADPGPAETPSQMVEEMRASGYRPGGAPAQGQQAPAAAVPTTARDAYSAMSIGDRFGEMLDGSPAMVAAAQEGRQAEAAAPKPQEAPAPRYDTNEFLNAHPTLNTIVKGGIEDLPVAGGLVGGVLGAELGPGAIATAGGGAAIGEAAAQALRMMIYGKQSTLMQSLHEVSQQGQEMTVASAAGEGALKVAGAGAKALAKTSAGSKVGALVSGVSDTVIKAYADGAQRIKAAFAEGGESSFRMAEAARKQYITDLVQTRSALNDTIGKGVEDSSAVIRSEPIIENLKASSAKLNPKLDGAQIDEINALIKSVEEVSFKDGSIPIQTAQQLKVKMQGIADGAYSVPGVNNAATPAQQAAKGAAAVTRQTMEPVLPKSVLKANKDLSTLHTIEDNMNKALLNPRASSSQLAAAGRNTTEAGAKNLADLQDMQAITGRNMVQPAQDIAAAQDLGKYKFKPSLRGLGQPLLKGALDIGNVSSAVGTTLGQSVMHGMNAVNSLNKVGGR